MVLYKVYPFEFEREKYEMKIFQTDRLINFVVFKKNRPATGIRHQIQIPETIEVKSILNNKAMNHFIELSKKEITDNLWKNLVT